MRFECPTRAKLAWLDRRLQPRVVQVQHQQGGVVFYCSFGIWDDEEALVAARPEMIAFLDTLRHLLCEISPELGVTDPISGEVLLLDGIDWRSGTLNEYVTELPDVEYNEPPDWDG